MTRIAPATLAALLAPLMFGQFQNTSMRSSGNSTEITFSTFRPDFAPTLTGAPYCADQVSENVQTLADGRTCRDSQDRVRTERPLIRAPFVPNASEVMLVEIRDPVGGSFYVLDASNKIAHRMAIPTEPTAQQTARGAATTSVPVVRSSAPAPAKATQTPKATSTSEQLPTQMIEGVMAEGRRTSTTYPIGSMGNDREIVTTYESWWSKDLGLAVMNRNSDPRNGEHTVRLTNISRAEPQISLFQPPPDYKIVEETGGFTMTIQRQ